MHFSGQCVRVFRLLLGLGVVLVELLGGADFASAQGSKRRRIALLIGIQRYDSEDMTDLAYAENDVEDLALVLQKGPAPYEVKVMTPQRGAKDSRLLPTADNIRDRLKEVTADLGQGDLVLVALTGHGFQEEQTGNAFFCAYQASLKQRANLLPLDEVYQSLGHCSASLKVLFVDACRDAHGVPLRESRGVPRAVAVRKANFGKPLTTGPAPLPGLVVLYSCSPGELSWESPGLKHGVFMHYVVEGLTGRAAGTEDDGISWMLLAHHAIKGVREYSSKSNRKQVPHVEANIAYTDLEVMLLDPGLASLNETFANVSGQLPAGWLTNDVALAVKSDGAAKGLIADKPGDFRIKTPRLRIDGDFYLEMQFHCYLPQDNLRLILSGRGANPDLELTLTRRNPGLYSRSMANVVLQHDASRDEFEPWGTRSGFPILRLERRGQTFTVQVNGKPLLSKAFPDHNSFERMTLELVGNTQSVNALVSEVGGAVAAKMHVRSLKFGPLK